MLKRIVAVALVTYVVDMALIIWATDHPGSKLWFAYSIGHYLIVPTLLGCAAVWLLRRVAPRS